MFRNAFRLKATLIWLHLMNFVSRKQSLESEENLTSGLNYEVLFIRKISESETRSLHERIPNRKLKVWSGKGWKKTIWQIMSNHRQPPPEGKRNKQWTSGLQVEDLRGKPTWKTSIEECRVGKYRRNEGLVRVVGGGWAVECCQSRKSIEI